MTAARGGRGFVTGMCGSAGPRTSARQLLLCPDPFLLGLVCFHSSLCFSSSARSRLCLRMGPFPCIRDQFPLFPHFSHAEERGWAVCRHFSPNIAFGIFFLSPSQLPGRPSCTTVLLCRNAPAHPVNPAWLQLLLLSHHPLSAPMSLWKKSQCKCCKQPVYPIPVFLHLSFLEKLR